MTGRASSSSSFSYQWTYDVFLNFRGEDTRNGFTGNLFNALRRKGVHTFMDDGELRKGDEITPSLLKAIEESRMAITVFSKNYASSTFCLDELVKILRCMKGNGRLVWPVFYDVEPSDVRHQKGNYEEALAMHQKYFKANEEKVQNWKLALREAANLSGLHFNPGHEYEYQFIEKIVNEISSKINRTPLHIAKYAIGLESRVIKINSLLKVESHDEVIMVGICGIGGMGKSTIARAVYNSIADQFEGLCFLHDIKENSSKLGLEQMQERMLSKTLGVNIKVEDVNEGIPIIKRRLNQKKILLILDNVDKQEQLENLVGNCDWFGSGSRIIITTRDKHLLARHGVERLYEMKEFNNEESIELLSWNAFKKNQVDPSYKKVLNCIVQYAKGLPLALEVIGSHLFGKSIEQWKSSADIYRRIPNEEVHKILKVSYDGLVVAEQEIFLDIASFFRGKDMKYVKDMIQHARGFDPSYGIGVLMDKCLINYGYDYVGMHDLIQDMGREIVRQESPNEPGKRSRLWNHEDIIHVLENNTGTYKITIIIQEYVFKGRKVNWDGKAFKKMVNLKILIFDGCFSDCLKYLPKSLRVLCSESNILQSLEPIKRLENLSVLELTYNKFITQIPNVSGIPNLMKLMLDSCQNLIEIHESVGYLPKLELLSAEWCENLRTFPRGFKLPSLKGLYLMGCSSLENFPKVLEKMEYMTWLDLSSTNLELPLSIELPRSITMSPELEASSTLCSNVEEITIRDCNISDEFLPFCLTWFANVKYLDLSFSIFTILPAHIKECRFLESLFLHACQHLREIRGIPQNIKFLYAYNCTSLSSESKSILLSQELHEVGDKQFLVPGVKIPQWSLDYYSKGATISFWFRNKFPAVVLYCVVTQAVDLGERYYCIEDLYANVIINEKEIFNDIRVWDEYGLYPILEDHIYLLGDGLRWIFKNNKMDNVFLKSEWNRVEVCLYLKAFDWLGTKTVKEIGVKVMKQENRREDIRFSNPYERTKLDDLNWNSSFMVSTWTSDQALLSSDTKEKDISKSEGPILRPGWQAPLAFDDGNLASFSMLSESTSHQENNSASDCLSLKEIGMNVMKQGNRREDIQFINPYKRKKLDDLNWDSSFGVSTWYKGPSNPPLPSHISHLLDRDTRNWKKDNIAEALREGINDNEDELIWHHEKLWKLHLPQKIKIFLWKAHHNGLAVEENLAARGINMHDYTCPNCGAVGEPIMHTLVACPFAEVIWSMSPLMLRSQSLPQASFSLWWEGLSGSLSHLKDSTGMLEVAGFICWTIWKCRNEKVFKRGSMGARQVMSLVMQQVNKFQASLQGPRGSLIAYGYASDTISSNQGYNIDGNGWLSSFSLLFGSTSHQENNSASDYLSIQAPLDEVNRASFLDLPGSGSDTTNHQGLQQKQYLTSINLEQIPKSSEVRGKDVIVYRRKRRRIH